MKRTIPTKKKLKRIPANRRGLETRLRQPGRSFVFDVLVGPLFALILLYFLYYAMKTSGDRTLVIGFGGAAVVDIFVIVGYVLNMMCAPFKRRTSKRAHTRRREW